MALAAATVAAVAAVGIGSGREAAPTVADARARPQVLLISGMPLATPPDASAPLAGFVDGPLLARVRAGSELREVDALPPPRDLDAPVWWIAHPLALPPGAIAAIDSHVRRGGAALIFADGLYTGETPHPLGDPRNPPVTSLLTPLLAHWGLSLDAPEGLTDTAQRAEVRGRTLSFRSPGTLRAASAGDATCRVEAGGLTAECAVGSGKAVVVADADLLTPHGEECVAQNGDWLLAELRKLSLGANEHSRNGTETKAKHP